MIVKLYEERDSLIYQLQAATEMESESHIYYLIGKLVQVQDLIKSMEE